MVSVGFARLIKLSPGAAPVAVDTTRLRPFAQQLPRAELGPLGGGQRSVVMQEATDHRFHPDLAPARVWTYGTQRDSDGRYPPLVLLARSGSAASVRFENQLPSGPGVTHPFLDLGLAMSTAAGQAAMAPYNTGWATPHLHGGHVRWTSDGHPVRVPGQRTVIAPGSSLLCRYPNDQPGATLWFHDHLMGATAANVYAGLVGMYLLRWVGPDGSTEADLDLPTVETGTREVPLVLGDRSFAADGQTIYGATFPWPDPAAPPIRAADQASEFKGDTVVVNNAVWPYLEVRPARYRLRIVNAAASRFFRLVLRRDLTPGQPQEPDDVRPDPSAGVPMLQIGGDGGFLPASISTDDPTGPGAVVLAPGERADVLIDLSGVPAGTDLVLTNEIRAESDVGMPSLEGNGGDLTVDPTRASGLRPTGLVLQFRVRGVPDPPAAPVDLRAATVGITRDLEVLRAQATQASTPVRSFLLRETDLPDGSADPQIATPLSSIPLGWYTPRDPSVPGAMNPVEVTALGAVEIWEILNNSPDSHPVHLHLVQFLALDRRPLSTTGLATVPYDGLEPGERGWKDTLRAATGHVTRFAVRFDGWRGRYVWHCHILEHEDMGMMRPLLVTVGGRP